MATYRQEIKHLVGRTISGITGVLAERSGGNTGYGFLLTKVDFPDGSAIDHVWFGGGEGWSCMQWPDGSACLGEEIRFTGKVHEYWSEGAARHGRDYMGIGVAPDLATVEVLFDGEWLPVKQAATATRRQRRKQKQAEIADGTHVYRGTWAQGDGQWLVRTAKSPKPDSRCDVYDGQGMPHRGGARRAPRQHGPVDIQTHRSGAQRPSRPEGKSRDRAEGL